MVGGNKDLTHKIDRVSVDGLIVYQKDVTSVLTEDSYMGNIMIVDANINEDLIDQSTFSVDVIEAIA